MNIKMAIKHNYQQLNLKNKLSKQAEQKQIIDVENTGMVVSGEGCQGEWGEKERG